MNRKKYGRKNIRRKLLYNKEKAVDKCEQRPKLQCLANYCSTINNVIIKEINYEIYKNLCPSQIAGYLAFSQYLSIVLDTTMATHHHDNDYEDSNDIEMMSNMIR